jgi:hypothetical protein
MQSLLRGGGGDGIAVWYGLQLKVIIEEIS